MRVTGVPPCSGMARGEPLCTSGALPGTDALIAASDLRSLAPAHLAMRQQHPATRRAQLAVLFISNKRRAGDIRNGLASVYRSRRAQPGRQHRMTGRSRTSCRTCSSTGSTTTPKL